MSLASRFLTALAGLGLIWFLWPFGSNDNEVVKTVAPPPAGHEGQLFSNPRPERTQAENPATTQTLSKNGGAKDAPDERVANVAPGTAPRPTSKLKSKLFYRVIVRDGGTLQTGDTVIALDGIAAQKADAICKDAKGRKWSCGARARTALMRLIRGRAVSCRVPISGEQIALTARCTVGGTDLSLWTVAQGWAEPEAPADAKLTKAAGLARKKKIGIWR